MGDISQSFKGDVLAVEWVLVVITFSVDLYPFELLAFKFELYGLSLSD